MGRNKSPSENTIRMLCSKAAGMCEFEGCHKRLFYDNITLAEFNNAYVAHIVASSAKGPRGDKELSPKLSADLDNLMLMCADHHRLIDQAHTGPRDYPVERLKKMKKDHEERVEKFCKFFHTPESEIVMFSSPIKGKTRVNIDYNMAAKALLPLKQPASRHGIAIDIDSMYGYKTQEYWHECVNKLCAEFEYSINNPYIKRNQASFSVFPLAPIPLIIKLGELIGDKLPCEVFQKTKTPDTWEWQSNECTNSFSYERLEKECKSNNVALIVSITGDICIERLPTSEYKEIFTIKAKNIGSDVIKSVDDLEQFWRLYQEVYDIILNTYGNECAVHLFPAVPVSVAFEMGRRYMKHTYPAMKIFDECDGFFETITIGGEK